MKTGIRSVLVLLLAVGTTGVGALSGCRPVPEGPSVLVIMVDTLRADSLGLYGFEGPTSPFLDRWASSAVVFTSCRSQAPWTVPSVASILTGWHPVGVKAQPPAGAPRMAPSKLAIPAEATTLAESFAANGWSTAAFIANPWLAPELGFHRGFEHVEDTNSGLPADDDEKVFKRAGEWLIEQGGRRPWFAYVHLMGVHGPYDAPIADVEAVSGAPGLGESRALTAAEREAIPKYLLKADWATGPAAEDLRTWRVRYAAGVRRLDRQLAAFIESLDTAGALDGAIVVLTSDHGEELAEHGGWDHGLSLYEHQLRVPLVVRVPGAEGRRIEEPVELVDLAPTLRAMAGVPAAELTAGVDLSTLLDTGDPQSDAATVLASGVKYLPNMHTVIDGRFKLIENLSTGGVAVFDLVADPDEQHNLANDDPQRTVELRNLLRTELDARVDLTQIPPPVQPEVSEERRRMLEELGYVEESGGR
jgi:arylsulfatase A-like enzyme